MKFLLLALFVFLGSNARALEWEKTRIETIAKPGAETVFVVFPFKNTNQTKVQILGITTSCGCTEAFPSSSEIAAGKTGRIEVVFTIGQRTGLQEKEILVRTDETREPVKLTLKVEIPPKKTEPQG